MLRKALIALYATEAIYLLVPWQLFINGRLRLYYNEGIVMWLGVPGFYALARIVMRQGSTLWARLGGMAWALMWIVTASVLIDDYTESGLLLRLGSWILIANFLVVVGPLGWALRRPSPGVTEPWAPSAVTLGVASWLLPVSFPLAIMVEEYAPWSGRTDRAIATLFVPFILLSPVLATAGVLKGFLENRSERRWSSEAGLILCAAFLGAFGAVFVCQSSISP